MEGFNVKNIIRFKNDIYAGVLGKIIVVYLGRPVEGWTYEAIRDTFGAVSYTHLAGWKNCWNPIRWIWGRQKRSFVP